MSMNLFGGAAKFVDFENSKGESFVANSNGTQFGTMVNNEFVPYSIFTSSVPVNPMLSVPLTLEAMEDGTVVKFDNFARGPITYKINEEAAYTINESQTVRITLNSIGDKVEFFGNNSTYKRDEDCSHITCNKDCYIYGNIMSLVNSTNFESATTLTGNYTFDNLFLDNTHVKNKSGMDLILPATTLTVGCYRSMFEGCTGLTSTPELPATTLAEQCYCRMFFGCSGLTKAPELPATTLSSRCYSAMFYGCTSLTTAPELPAPTLAEGCYQYMFESCTNLNSVTCLATSWLYGAFDYWLDDVSSSGTFTKASGMTGWPTGADGIPDGWTVQDYIA